MSEALAVVRTIPPAPPVAWSDELAGAKYLLASGLCPEALRTPEAVLFVMLTGRDLGLSAVASLRNIVIVKGKVEVSADMQLALFAKAGGTFRWGKLMDTEAELVLSAPWMDGPHTSRFTMADAQRAGLAASDNYKKYPKAMLRSRAITQGLKDVGFDATAGVYAPGELGTEVTVEDGAPVPVATVPPRDVAPAQTLEPVGQGDAAEPEPATEAQRALLARLARSSVWSPEEADKIAAIAARPGMAKVTMSERIDATLLELTARKRAARKAGVEVEDVGESEAVGAGALIDHAGD